jgi:dihydroneopterin aldolase
MAPDLCSYLRQMLSIHLYDVQFYAYHGLYADEKLKGNQFVIDLEVKYHPAAIPVTSIHQTIDYVALYGILQKRMSLATPLLETLVMDIARQIMDQYKLVEEVNISIKKLHPPISNFDGIVGVSFELKRS